MLTFAISAFIGIIALFFIFAGLGLYCFVKFMRFLHRIS